MDSAPVKCLNYFSWPAGVFYHKILQCMCCECESLLSSCRRPSPGKSEVIQDAGSMMSMCTGKSHNTFDSIILSPVLGIG